MSFALTIFDYDGVLIDSLDCAISASEEFCRSISHEQLPTKETIGLLEIMTYTEIGRSIGLSTKQIKNYLSYVFENYQKSSPSMAFYPEIESLLHRIISRNIAIVSGNAKHVISSKLETLGLTGKISCIFGAYEPGNKAEKIQKACNHFGVDVGHSCMIGDSVSDIRYAKMAGARSIAVTWGWQCRGRLAREKPDFIVNSVQELAVLLF